MPFMERVVAAFDSGGAWAAVGVIGVWAWRTLVGAHKLGRIEQKLDTQSDALAKVEIWMRDHQESEERWRARLEVRIDELYGRR